MALPERTTAARVVAWRMRLGLMVVLLSGCEVRVGSPDVPEPDVVCEPAVPTPHGLRRLTASQYRRVVADLLGEAPVGLPPLPTDGGGFEAVPAAQTVSPALVDGWEAAATAVAEQAVARPARSQRIEVERLGWEVGEVWSLPGEPSSGWWQFDLPDGVVEVPVAFEVPATGHYQVSVRATWTVGFEQVGSPPQVSLTLGGQATTTRQVTGRADLPVEVDWGVDLEAGVVSGVLRITGPTMHLQAVAVDRLDVTGPVGGQPLFSPARARLFPCDDADEDALGCVSQHLASFTRRAWRRTPTADEQGRIDTIVAAAVADGDGLDAGLRDAVRAVLLSPAFLFRAEETAGLAAGEARAATPREVFDRLSVLLWGGLTDETLLQCAEGGAAQGAEGLCTVQNQVARMLADPKARFGTDELARQWFGLDAITSGAPEPDLDPLPPGLRAALAAETPALLDAIRRARRPLVDLLDAPSTVVTPEVAAWYGVGHPGEGEAEVQTLDRVGVLGHAGVLVSTSYPDRTSPVLRGRWVLDRLMCDPPDAPPDGVPSLPAQAATGDVAAMLEAHRADPACAFCHDAIDPLGLALEGYDPTGRARDAYPDGAPLPEDGHLTDGTPVPDLFALAAALRAHEGVERCLTEKVLTWALERPILADDRCLVEEIQGGADGTLEGVVSALLERGLLTTVVGAP